MGNRVSVSSLGLHKERKDVSIKKRSKRFFKKQNSRLTITTSNSLSSISVPSVNSDESRNISVANAFYLLISDDILFGRDMLMRDKDLRDNFISFILEGHWINEIAQVSKDLLNLHTQTEIKPLQANINGNLTIKISLHNLEIVTENHDILTIFPEQNQISFILLCLWKTFAKKSNKNDKNQKLSKDNNIQEKIKNKEHSSLVRNFKNEISKTDKKCLLTQLSTGLWVEEALIAFDFCEINICIARVTEFNTFPIIYVNKSYENSLMVAEGMLLGKNLIFMLEKWSKFKKIGKFVNSIQSGLPMESSIISKNTGDLYFLKVEPIFNSIGEYQYVICTHVDMSKPKWKGNGLNMVDEAIWALKGVL